MLPGSSRRFLDDMSIFDWKRSKHGFRRGISGIADGSIGPLHGYPNTKTGRYALQLNCYRVILENEYGYEIKSMYLVRFHSDSAAYEILEVPRSDFAVSLMDHYRLFVA